MPSEIDQQEMKKVLLKIIPRPLLVLYRKIRYPNGPVKGPQFLGKPVEETFTAIYKSNFWGSEESISGGGSVTSQTETIVREIGPLLKKMNFSSVLDIPCGDFLWMRKVDLSSVSYLGADIVKDLINKNKQKYYLEGKVDFIKLNLIEDKLPVKDLVIVRDCLVHLSFESIFQALKNIKSSGCKYLLTTTFPEHHQNVDIITGQWRTLDLTAAPFNFPKPVYLINENCTEMDNAFTDKSLGLWLIKDLPVTAG